MKWEYVMNTKELPGLKMWKCEHGFLHVDEKSADAFARQFNLNYEKILNIGTWDGCSGRLDFPGRLDDSLIDDLADEVSESLNTNNPPVVSDLKDLYKN